MGYQLRRERGKQLFSSCDKIAKASKERQERQYVHMAGCLLGERHSRDVNKQMAEG